MRTAWFVITAARLNIICFLLLSVTFASGQKVENLRLQQSGDKVLIQFDFLSVNSETGYQVRAYHSGDGFVKPINLARGDIGDNVLPGRNKQIEWFAAEELGGFKGNLVIEIRVFLTPENLYIQRPAVNHKLKRGQALNINWSGGINEDKVTLSLLQDGRAIETLANNIDNNGSYSWLSPKKIKPGKNYAIRVAGAGMAGKGATSSSFTISRKVPLWLVIAPVAVIGAGVAVLLSGDSSGGENNNLPGAPDPN